MRALFILALAIGLPILAGLAWHHASDNPAWPLLRNSLNLCQLRDSPLSPISPDGFYRARVVQASCFGRFDETLVFVTLADNPWSLTDLQPNRAVLEVAGLRSLDAINWQIASEPAPVLQLWLTPDALSHQIHHIDRLAGSVLVQPLTSSPASGADRLDY